MNPKGQFEAVEARGSMLGNRGCIHDHTGAILSKAFQRTAWLVCDLHYRGRRLSINAPGAYTALFFLDEATALAAGHRPCALCRRPAYEAFRAAWRSAHGLGRAPLAVEIDAELHDAMIDGIGRQQTHHALLSGLPDGVMVEAPGSIGHPALVWRGELHPWAHTGYGTPLDLDPERQVVVLTPAPTVTVLTAGYVPKVALQRAPAGISDKAIGRCLAS